MLRSVAMQGRPRTVGVPAGELPPELREAVEAAARDAYERGVRDGIARGEAGAAGRIDALAGRVTDAFRDGLEALAAARRARAAETAELALEIARAVLGREPADPGAIVARACRALEDIADGPVVATAHPDVCDALRAAGIETVADPSMEPSDVVLHGPWSAADLTARAALDAVRDVLMGG